jgi:hypothetical protein
MKFYKINEPDVSAEFFEEEVLAINLKTGNYYSLRYSALAFWRLITEGNSVEETIITLSKIYSEKEEGLLSEFTDFLKSLLDNQLLVETNEYKSSTTEEWLNTTKKEYQKPVLEAYSDMRDLLLIDPIHEVDVTRGWPNKPNESTDQAKK